jgi:hypothetical protein
MSADILRDLARAKAVFQLRAIEAVIRGGDPALAAAARQGGDVEQAPAESPQSGPSGSEGNARPLPPLPPSKDTYNHG